VNSGATGSKMEDRPVCQICNKQSVENRIFEKLIIVTTYQSIICIKRNKKNQSAAPGDRL
jgi:recombinational DNA repair protein RecR